MTITCSCCGAWADPSPGSKTHWEYTASFDGKPHPVTGNPDGDMVVLKRVNATTIESSYTLKGKPTTVNTRVVSADGKTMTVTSKGMNARQRYPVGTPA